MSEVCCDLCAYWLPQFKECGNTHINKCINKEHFVKVERNCGTCEREIRANAIDEFVKAENYLMDKIKEETADVNIDFEWRKVVCLDDIRRMLHQGLCEIAEQMKAGGKNE